MPTPIHCRHCARVLGTLNGDGTLTVWPWVMEKSPVRGRCGACGKKQYLSWRTESAQEDIDTSAPAR
jgi:hypothetical protein